MYFSGVNPPPSTFTFQPRSWAAGITDDSASLHPGTGQLIKATVLPEGGLLLSGERLMGCGACDILLTAALASWTPVELAAGSDPAAVPPEPLLSLLPQATSAAAVAITAAAAINRCRLCISPPALCVVGDRRFS